jgi:hypothetical protein
MDCVFWCGRCSEPINQGRKLVNCIALRSLLQIHSYRANNPSSGGLEVAGLSICRKDVIEWLTDENWIVLCFYSGFAYHLEQYYFMPETSKNAEFEIMVAPVALVLKGMYGEAPFCRIKDTPENRELLRVAIAEFHDKRLLPAQQLSANIQELRQKIRENVIPGLK